MRDQVHFQNHLSTLKVTCLLFNNDCITDLYSFQLEHFCASDDTCTQEAKISVRMGIFWRKQCQAFFARNCNYRHIFTHKLHLNILPLPLGQGSNLSCCFCGQQSPKIPLSTPKVSREVTSRHESQQLACKFGGSSTFKCGVTHIAKGSEGCLCPHHSKQLRSSQRASKVVQLLMALCMKCEMWSAQCPSLWKVALNVMDASFSIFALDKVTHCNCYPLWH